MQDIIEYARSRFTEKESTLWERLSTRGRFELLREFIKHDLHTLVFLLGYRDIGAFHDAQITALSQVRRIDNNIETRRLWLWSRGFFKTSLITEAHSVYLIINNPSIRILLASNTISVAEDMLRNIKNHFIGNVAFRYFFKEFCPIPNSVGKVEFGTSEDFTVAARTQARKEPTMMVAGIGTNLTGLHFDYMKLDDLVTKDSVTNDTQIAASKDYYASLRHLYDKAACPREDVVGTIYHFNDLYSSILRPMVKTGEIKESFIPAKIDEQAVFPERLPEVALQKLIADPSVGPYQFQTQYMLNPINPADAKFKEAWLKTYDSIPAGLAEYICVDPASKQQKKSDYTVIERWGVDDQGRAYLLEGVRDKLTAFQRIDKLFEFIEHSKNLKWVKYEVLGGRHGDLEVIEERKKEFVKTHNRGFTVRETKASSASKKDRIEQRLVGQYHAGNIFFPSTMYYVSRYDGKVYDFVQLLKLEYLQFPFTEHDDILDAQAQLYEEPLIRGEKTVKTMPSAGMTANDWDSMYKQLDKIKMANPELSHGQVHAKMANMQLNKKFRRLAMGR